MSESEIEKLEYTCVLTSCNRFDVLEKTLISLFEYLDVPPKKFILIEDSGNHDVLNVVKKIDFPIEVIINPMNLGQARAIDIAYSKVETPYIFHCEDDWEFTRSGFIKESYEILKLHPEASLVQLRGRSEHVVLKDLPQKQWQHISYFLAEKTTHKRYFSYGYNPSLRRLIDYQRIAPLASIGGEREVSWVFKKMGFVTAHLEQEAVRILGDGMHIEDQTASRKGLRRQFRSLNNIYKRAKWFLTGFPKFRI